MNTLKLKNYILILFLIPVLSSCFYDEIIVGNDIVIEDERYIPDFESITVAGDFEVYFEYAEEPELLLICESNIAPYVETVVYNDDLKIKHPFNVNIHNNSAIEVYVKGPYVERLKLSGSGVIVTDTIYDHDLDLKISGSGDIFSYFIGENINATISGYGDINLYTICNDIDAKITGSGAISLEGLASNGNITVTGSGKIKAYDFPMESGQLLISGSGNMYVNISEYMRAIISGSGDIHYIGYPELDYTISGTGNLINEN